MRSRIAPTIKWQREQAALAQWDTAVRAYRADPYHPEDFDKHRETYTIGFDAIQLLARTFDPDRPAGASRRLRESMLVVSPAGVACGL